MKFRSTKKIDGFSTVFRQWKATDTHCRFLHGYAIGFNVVFEGSLDHRNWVVDFGGLKRSKVKIDNISPKEWFTYMFDHTTIVAKDDPHMDWFVESDVLQLRVIDEVGTEMFAKFVFEKLDKWVKEETNGRAHVVSVECYEHEKNSAIYTI